MGFSPHASDTLSEAPAQSVDIQGDIFSAVELGPNNNAMYEKDARLRREFAGATVAGLIGGIGLLEFWVTKNGLSHSWEVMRMAVESGKHFPIGCFTQAGTDRIAQAWANRHLKPGSKAHTAVGVGAMAVGGVLTGVADIGAETAQAMVSPADHYKPFEWIQEWGPQGNGQDFGVAEAGAAFQMLVNPEQVRACWRGTKAPTTEGFVGRIRPLARQRETAAIDSQQEFTEIGLPEPQYSNSATE